MIQVCAAVIVQDQKVFIAQRKKDSHQGGLWEFPGGKLEKGETPHECLKRELLEELSVKAEIGSFIGASTYEYPEKSICLSAYFVSIKDKPVLKEHEALAWVFYSELLNYPLAPADRPIAKALIDIIARGGSP